MKYIKSFETEAAFEAGKGDLSIPYVAYTQDDEQVHYARGIEDIANIIGTVKPGITSFSFELNITTVNATVIGNKFYYVLPSDMTITTVTQCFANNQNIVSLDKFDVPVPVGSDNQSFFYNCNRELTGATLYNANPLTRIGANCFYNCTKLSSIEIPNTVTLINENAFRNCTSLTSIIFPASLEKIGRRVCQGCSNLTSATCLATTPPGRAETSLSLMFEGCSENLVIYVPAESVNAYKTAEGWREYTSRIQAIPTT